MGRRCLSEDWRDGGQGGYESWFVVEGDVCDKKTADVLTAVLCALMGGRRLLVISRKK